MRDAAERHLDGRQDFERIRRNSRTVRARARASRLKSARRASGGSAIITSRTVAQAVARRVAQHLVHLVQYEQAHTAQAQRRAPARGGDLARRADHDAAALDRPAAAAHADADTGVLHQCPQRLRRLKRELAGMAQDQDGAARP